METLGSGWQPNVLGLEHAYLNLRSQFQTLTRFVGSLERLVSAADHPEREGNLLILLGQMLRDAMEIIEAKDGSVLVLDPATQELAFLLSAGDLSEDALLGLRIPAGQGVAGWVATSRRAVIVNNSSEDARFYPDIDRAFEFHTESILAVPIIGGGLVLGVMEALNKKHGQRFSQSDKSLLSLLARIAGEVCHSLDQRCRQTEAINPPANDLAPVAPLGGRRLWRAAES
jgi:GAF domain-containing protein